MVGTVVGNYKIIQQIGEGGMGAVFKGVDLMLEREVAIKVLRPELARQPQIVERFRAEAVTLAKLNHPNIATLHSFFRQGDDYFMVMEFVKGETLDHAIRARGAMAVDRAISVFCQALDGIDHAHRMGIIHRDIKPANIMLTESHSTKVMDFGIARVLGSARMTREGHLIGTIEYMSPEQIRGQETDARADIYSLGILLYEMLTGRVPFDTHSEYDLMKSQIEAAPPPPRDFAPHISLPIEEAIMRSLAKRPEARFQTAGEFRVALLSCMHAATNPLDTHRVAGYVAPTTAANQPSAYTPTTGDPRETRLPSNPSPVPAVGGGFVNGLSPTRLAPQGEYPPVYQQEPAFNPQAGVQSAPAAPRTQASLFSRLSWKHYTVAGAGLVALLTVPFLILGLSGKGETQKPAATTTQPQPAPVTTRPASQTGSDGLIPGEIPPADSGKGATGKSGRRNSTSDKTGQPPDSASSTPAQTATDQTHKPAGHTKDKPPAAKDTTAKTDNKDDKKDDKGSKIGGFFKKIGGIIGGGDKDKDKKPKKP